MEGLERGGMERECGSVDTCYQSSFVPLLLSVFHQISFAPFSIQRSNRFICCKWTIEREVEFSESSHRHAQAHTSLSLQIFILCLSPLIFFLRNPVPISVSKTTTSSVSWGFAIKSFADGTKKYQRCSFFVSLVWDIGDEEKAMIANCLLMLCLKLCVLQQFKSIEGLKVRFFSFLCPLILLSYIWSF